MTIEEQGVETACWGHLLAEIEEVYEVFFCIRILCGKEKWGAMVVEGGSGIAQKAPDVHG